MLKYTLSNRAGNNNNNATLVLMVRCRLSFGLEALHPTARTLRDDTQLTDGNTADY